VVIPLSRTNIAALFVILFIYGWNQYCGQPPYHHLESRWT
jgi:ABC-type glycerol-3-phosphate transport system permease component